MAVAFYQLNQTSFEKGVDVLPSVDGKITNLSIFCKYPSCHVKINNELYELGKTGIFEIHGTVIESLSFEDDVNTNIQVTYTVEPKY